MPMKTTVVRRKPRDAASLRSSSACATISFAVRLRVKPPIPLAQNEQPAPQPTWVDTQAADLGRRCRGAPSARFLALICARDQLPRTPGIRTLSMARPSASRSRNFVVPSGASVRAATRGICNDSPAATARSRRPCHGSGSKEYAARSDRSTVTGGATAPKRERSSEAGMSNREVTAESHFVFLDHGRIAGRRVACHFPAAGKARRDPKNGKDRSLPVFNSLDPLCLEGV